MRASQTIGKWRTAYELSELYTATEEAAGKVTTMASEASDARNGVPDATTTATGAINDNNKVKTGDEKDGEDKEQEVPFRKCSVCHVVKPFDKLKKCSRCKNPYYVVCSIECQDWKHHRKTCRDAKAQKLHAENLANGQVGVYGQIPTANPPLSREAIVVPVMDPGDPLGFVYTKGLHELHGLPELLAMDIPAEKMVLVQYLVHELAFQFQTFRAQNLHKFYHRYRIEMQGIWMTALHPQTDEQLTAFRNNMGTIHSRANVIAIKPVFDKWECEPSVPASLKRHEPQIETVLAKWRQYREDQAPDSDALEQDIVSKEDLATECAARGLWSEKETALFRGETEASYLRRLGYLELCAPDTVGCGLFLDDVASNLHRASDLYKQGEKVARGKYMWKYYRDIVD